MQAGIDASVSAAARVIADRISTDLETVKYVEFIKDPGEVVLPIVLKIIQEWAKKMRKRW